jgi:hypothetical protein
MKNNTYPPHTEERMDISFITYFSTVSLGLMCYSFFNPGFVFDLSIFLAYGFAKTMVSSYSIFNEYIYTPYKKHIKKPLMNILNIDNGLYEIEVVKDGNIIYRFKKMSDFIKYNTIKFVEDDNDDEGDDDEDDEEDASSKSGSESNSDTKPQVNSDSNVESDIKVETPIDADLTHETIDIHTVEPSTEDLNEDESGDEDDESRESGESEEVDTDDTNDNDDDNLILDPNEYDFVLRNIYFEDEATNTPFGYCLKYETFRKSDMKPSEYTYEDMKKMLSKRRFIGIHLKMDEKDYIINLSTPVNYYLVNNTILDYSFLKMYLFNRYNVILGNTYKLSCIDNFIEMYTIEQGKKFYVKMNSLNIVDDETYNVDASPSPLESALSPSVSEEHKEPLVQETGDALTEADIEIVECNYSC